MFLSLIFAQESRLQFQEAILTKRNSQPSSWVKVLIFDGMLPSSIMILPLGLAFGLIFKRIFLRLEAKCMDQVFHRCARIIISSISSVVVADLLLEWCLVGWHKFGHRMISAEIPYCSFAAACIHFVTLFAGVRLGERFVPVALTGSIATGKSTVAKLLIESDPHCIIDTDAIAHEILLPPQEIKRSGVWCGPKDSVFDQIVSKFGDPSIDNKNILNDDGMIERRKLGDIVFKDRSRRSVLNGITHPKIIWVLLKRLVIGLYCTSRRLIVADVPLLFESKSLVCMFALSIVVACSQENQLIRLRKRNPDLSEEQCRERIASQIPVERKILMADIVIHNNGSQTELKKEVKVSRQRIATMLSPGQGALPLSTSVALIGMGWVIMDVAGSFTNGESAIGSS